MCEFKSIQQGRGGEPDLLHARNVWGALPHLDRLGGGLLLLLLEGQGLHLQLLGRGLLSLAPRPRCWPGGRGPLLAVRDVGWLPSRDLGGGGGGLGAGGLEEGTGDPRGEAETRVHLEARERHRRGDDVGRRRETWQGGDSVMVCGIRCGHVCVLEGFVQVCIRWMCPGVYQVGVFRCV